MDPDEKGGPDGMKVDREGRVYVAVAQGVWVSSPTASCWGSSPRRSAPRTSTGGDATARRLAITAVNYVYKVRFKVAGFHPALRAEAGRVTTQRTWSPSGSS